LRYVAILRFQLCKTFVEAKPLYQGTGN